MKLKDCTLLIVYNQTVPGISLSLKYSIKCRYYATTGVGAPSVHRYGAFTILPAILQYATIFVIFLWQHAVDFVPVVFSVKFLENIVAVTSITMIIVCHYCNCTSSVPAEVLLEVPA